MLRWEATGLSWLGSNITGIWYVTLDPPSAELPQKLPYSFDILTAWRAHF